MMLQVVGAVALAFTSAQRYLPGSLRTVSFPKHPSPPQLTDDELGLCRGPELDA
jgi:hypothetical protein